MTDYLHGVDISAYQPNWTPGSNDYYVFIKSTEGQSWSNKYMTQQVDKARKANLVVGFYHYLWPEFANGKKISGSPEVQAAWFVKNALIKDGDILVCDWEHAGSYTAGEAGGYATEDEKDRFIAEVQRLKPYHQVGVYTYRNLWNDPKKNKKKTVGDFLWIADYNPTAPKIVEPWVFWQYSDKPIDQNYVKFTTQAELREFAEEKMPLSDADIDKVVSKVVAQLKPAIDALLNKETVTKADIPTVDQIVAGVPTLEQLKKELPKAVWTADIIPAPKADPKNPNWQPASYLKNTYNKIPDPVTPPVVNKK